MSQEPDDEDRLPAGTALLAQALFAALMTTVGLAFAVTWSIFK